ncbi:hypothetical protein KCP77_11115 [Salmonella enterica subsp. enterica]|nr:hypothetical protein KCP77_11115 [Salmonella enterica subsp. enterica]
MSVIECGIELGRMSPCSDGLSVITSISAEWRGYDAVVVALVVGRKKHG